MIRLAAALVLMIASFMVVGGPRQMAITFDDLPWTTLQRVAPEELPKLHGKLIAALEGARIPVTGFVNEGKLFVHGEIQAKRVVMLEDWLGIGAELGNHTFGHVDLHAVGLDAYKADILRGEQTLRPLLARHNATPRFFRHPYLRAGQSMEVRKSLAAFLAEHGYRVAPVTVDNSEWIWALAYRRAFEQQAPEALKVELREEYVEYMLNKIVYFEQQAFALFRRDIAQVLLLHANRINADTFDELIDQIQGGGYQIIDLETALADPAYQHEDGYFGAYGPSWIHRWAMAEGKKRAFFGNEPKTPQWVLDLAGVESE